MTNKVRVPSTCRRQRQRSLSSRRVATPLALCSVYDYHDELGDCNETGSKCYAERDVELVISKLHIGKGLDTPYKKLILLFNGHR